MVYVVQFLQMIAHGFVVVGLFLLHRRYETRTIDEMGGIRTQAPNFDVLYWYWSGCITNYF
jgi:NADH-quinone oxidoreductase subunit M